MANPQIQQNVIPVTDPQTSDLLNIWKKNINIDLTCHHIGVVQSFDPSNQTATATIAYKKTLFNLNQASGQYDPVLVDYPILLDCPVICLGGGKASLTFPIQKGDECLVLFNDRSIDSWFQSGQSGPVSTSRLHSFSDGLILVGIRSLANVLENYDSTHAVLQYDETMVAVGDKVKIANDSDTLNSLLQELLSEIQELITQVALITVTCAAPGNPSSPPINAPDITEIADEVSNTAMKIGGLLE